MHMLLQAGADPFTTCGGAHESALASRAAADDWDVPPLDHLVRAVASYPNLHSRRCESTGNLILHWFVRAFDGKSICAGSAGGNLSCKCEPCMDPLNNLDPVSDNTNGITSAIRLLDAILPPHRVQGSPSEMVDVAAAVNLRGQTALHLLASFFADWLDESMP